MEPEASPPTIQTEAPETPLPEGWENAVSPVDGKKYYYNAGSGVTSWAHPGIPGSQVVEAPSNDVVETAPSIGDYSGIIANRSTMVDYGGDLSNKTTLTTQADKDVEEGDVYTKMTEYDPKEPIRSHRCYSVIAMILFFPLGAIAFCKSFATVSQWKQEQYEKAHNSGQQALLFSRISCIIGAIFWSYFFYCLFAGPEAPFVVDVPAEWWPDIDMNVREYFTNKEE